MRSDDFATLKKEAELLKRDFERRLRESEEETALLTERLRDREERIAHLERRLQPSTTESDEAMSSSESRMRNNVAGVASPGTSPDRIPQRKYRATRSYDENTNAAVVGGAPILYRSPSSNRDYSNEYYHYAAEDDGKVESGDDVDDPSSLHRTSRTEEEFDPSTVYYDTSIKEQFESANNDNINGENHYPRRPNGIGNGNWGILRVTFP